MNRVVDFHTAQCRRLQDIIISDKINLIDPILLMCSCRIIRMSLVRPQKLSQIDLIGITDSIGSIAYIVLIKFIITVLQQFIRDTLPVRIQYIYIKIHSLFQQTPGRILLEKRFYFRIGYIIFNGLNDIRLSGSHVIVQFYLLLFDLCRTFHSSCHISHIMHSLRDFLFRTQCFIFIIYHGSITYSP